MKEHPVDSDQAHWSSSAATQQASKGRIRLFVVRAGSIRVVVGILGILVLLLSTISFSIVAQNSYAKTNSPSAAIDTPCATTTPPMNVQTPTPIIPGQGQPTPTPTTKPPTPTPKPKTPTPIPPTPTPIPPTPTPVTPTPVDTTTPTVSVMTPTPEPTTSVTPMGEVVLLSELVSCTPTPTATNTPDTGAGGAGPTPGLGATVTPETSNGSGGPTTNASSGKFPMNIVMLVGLVLLGLLLSAGIGWYVFRRMLLPANEVKLPPSGARPWSRTRGPSVDHNNNNGNAGNAALGNMNAFLSNAAQRGLEQSQNGIVPLSNMSMNGSGFAHGAPVTGGLNNGFAGNMPDFEHAARGLNTPPPAGFAPQGRPGSGQLPTNGFAAPGNNFSGGLTEGFVPPSPQTFSQSETSMIPPGSGAFPVVNNGGYTPASSAFNAMYGLPGDPFSSSQGNAPNWMQNIEQENRRQRNTSGSFSGSLQPPQTTTQAPQMSLSGNQEINDPYLAEVIRQYSQKSQAIRPSQTQRTHNPPNNGPNSEWIK